MFTIYLALIPVVTLWAMFHGWKTGRPELARCGGVILAHAAAVQVWWWIMESGPWQGYPYLFMALSLAVVLRVICAIPASKWNAVLAGSVLFGILSSLIYGVHTLLSGYSRAADMNYGLAQFVMGWANLVILLGWGNEHCISRFANGIVRAVTGMVRAARYGGLAR